MRAWSQFAPGLERKSEVQRVSGLMEKLQTLDLGQTEVKISVLALRSYVVLEILELFLKRKSTHFYENKNVIKNNKKLAENSYLQ